MYIFARSAGLVSSHHGGSDLQVFLCEIMDRQTRSDCISEINFHQSLQHPHIVRVVASFFEANDMYLVLEVCEGGDLSQLLSAQRHKGQPLEEAEVWRLFRQVCTAVEFMHQNRIMHRVSITHDLRPSACSLFFFFPDKIPPSPPQDIKPGNIFLAADGTAKIGDLGLSRYFSSKTLQAQSMVGTPAYMVRWDRLIVPAFHFGKLHRVPTGPRGDPWSAVRLLLRCVEPRVPPV